MNYFPLLLRLNLYIHLTLKAVNAKYLEFDVRYDLAD